MPDEPLPFADGEFDLVLCAETIEHVRDVQLLLSEVRRVLRPGGRVGDHDAGACAADRAGRADVGFERVFDPLSPHLRFFTAASLSALLDEMGFGEVRVRRERGSLLVTAGR